MTLGLLVACGTLIFWLMILFARWLRVRPSSTTASQRAIFSAAGLSGALVGGWYPIAWAMLSNLDAYRETGTTTFKFAGHLPPGVDEDDLIFFLVIGMAILLIQAIAEVWRACR